MIGRWGLYADLMTALRKCGLPPDTADQAARVAERAVRERRDAMIVAAAATGISHRKIAQAWGVTRQMVTYIVAQANDANRGLPPPATNLPSAKGQAGE
jgi:hypothetical protein